MNSHTIQLSFFFIMSGVVAVLAFFILKPFLGILVLAGTCAVIFYPLYKKILNFFGEKRAGISAFLTITLGLILILAPLTLLGLQIFKEAKELQQSIRDITDQEKGILSNLPPAENELIMRTRERFEGFVTEASVDFGQLAQRAVGWVLSNIGGFFESVGRVVLAIFLWLLSFYYFLRDGYKLKKILITLSPLSDQYDREIISKAVSSIKSVVGGTLIVALIQGFLAGVGFAVFQIPNPSIWGALAVLAALIPSVGTAIVTLPAILYLVFAGNFISVVGLLVWSVIIVAGVDNVLRPKLIERGIHVHSLVILLSVLGGIAVFGPIGFLVGPIVMSLLGEFLGIYRHLVLKK